jgi:hypothetical protein
LHKRVSRRSKATCNSNYVGMRSSILRISNQFLGCRAASRELRGREPTRVRSSTRDLRDKSRSEAGRLVSLAAGHSGEPREVGVLERHERRKKRRTNG